MRMSPLTDDARISNEASPPSSSPGTNSVNVSPDVDETSNHTREPEGTPTSISPDTERSETSARAEAILMSPDADMISAAPSRSPTSMSPDAVRPLSDPPIEPSTMPPEAVAADPNGSARRLDPDRSRHGADLGVARTGLEGEFPQPAVSGQVAGPRHDLGDGPGGHVHVDPQVVVPDTPGAERLPLHDLES